MMEVIDKGKQVVVPAGASLPAQQKGGAGGNYNPYPPPLAKYEDVVANRELFMQTLEKLHSILGTKFMVPTIGGKELDLHRLFVEVTTRGGIEKVIKDRRWKEITAVFNFPSTATNASFVLRKYYISLMHHYEQIYFFGAQGWNSPPTVAAERSSESVIPPSETQAATQKRRKNTAGLSLPSNYPVVGVIDGKFEHGYLVTVTIGTEKLKGVLYRSLGCSSLQVPQNLGSVDNRTLAGGRRRRRKKKLSTIDPTHPKPNRSGYNFFFAEQHARLKPLHPGKDREISKIIGDLWNKLSETDKSVYQERGLQDKERYRSEMVIYRERQKTGKVISNAVPIRQRPAEPEATRAVVGTKMKTDEGDSFLISQKESSSSGSDVEDKKLDSDSEEEGSPDVGSHAESTDLTKVPLTESDGFELRLRDHAGAEDVDEAASSSEDGDSKEEVDRLADNR